MTTLHAPALGARLTARRRATQRTPTLRVRAAAEGNDSASKQLSYSEALQLLNLPDGATGEQLVQAKNAAVSRGSDVTLVDAAYDAVLQQSFSKRRTGAGVKLEVKYADVRLASPQAGKLGGGAKQAGTSSSRGGGPGGRGGGAAGGVSTEQLAQKLAASVPRVQVPEAAELTTLAALFAAAGLGTLAAGAMHVQGTADHAPGLPLALGFGAALYHLRAKAASLPRSAGITALGLSAGTLLGVAIQAALRVDIIPLGPLTTPSTVVAEGALAGMFAVAALLV